MFLKYLCPPCNRYVELGEDVPAEEARCPHCGGEVKRSQAPSRGASNPSLPGYMKWVLVGGIVLLAIGFYFANEVLLVVAGSIIGAALYFLPSLLAWQVGHRNFLALLVLNICLGWTILGWAGALVRALYRETK